MSFSERFRESWHSLTGGRSGSTFLIAVSGGIDSMVLATICLEQGISIAIAHCNFGLRGAESDGDEHFVRQWCAEQQVPLFVTKFDTAAVVAAEKKGIQQVARKLRYDWFNALCKEHGFKGILTAHHANDNAETMFINICRGTGIAGLHGIPPQNGNVLRPLLFAARDEIVAWAEEKNIAYRDDSSNAKDDYLRNFIRHHIIPTLDTQAPGLVTRMSETAARIAEAELIYNSVIQKEKKQLLQQRGADYYIPINLLTRKKPINTICYELLKDFGFTPAQSAQVVAHLLTAESGRFINSATHRLIRNRDFLVLTTLDAETTDLLVVDSFEEAVTTSDFTFGWAIKNASGLAKPNDNNTAHLDLSKLEKPIILRRWQEGDYFYPLGMGMKKKKLSRFFIDNKVPLHEKEKIWILESNKRIVWIAGWRIDERFSIKNTTTEVLIVTTKNITGAK